MDNSELYHHGILGMRWGVRRYQNKDGSLTNAGRSRYNKEMSEIQQEKANVAKELAAVNNRKRTQARLNKLELEKESLKAAKKALKDEKRNLKKNKLDETVEETYEERRTKALTSTNAKEVYDNRDTLTNQELNDRINRIDLESRLYSKISVEHKKTGMDYINDKMEASSNAINNITNLFKKIDNAYSTIGNSAIGRTLAKKLGIEPPKKEFNLSDVWKKRNSLSNEEIQAVSRRVTNESIIEKAVNKQKQDQINKQTLKRAQEQVNAYNDRWLKSGDGRYSKKGSDLKTNAKDNIGPEIERVVGEIVDVPVSRAPTAYLTSGQSYITALLEDTSRR